MEVQNVDSRSMSLNSLISSGKNMSILLLALAKLISKQGRPPRNSEKGAVRCCRRLSLFYLGQLLYSGAEYTNVTYYLTSFI